MPTSETHVYTGPLVGTGATNQVFPFDFEAISADEIEVLLDGVPVNPLNYGVTLNGDDTGSITATLAGAVTIQSKPSFLQTADFGRFAPYFPDQIVPPLDKLAKQDLWLKDQVDRAVKTPRGESAITLPPVADRANTFTGFGASGEFIAVPESAADGLLRTQLLSSTGASHVYATLAEGMSAVDLQTALALSLPLKPEFFRDETDPAGDDSLCFDRLTAYINSIGGGDIELSRTTYTVGAQVFDGSAADNWAYKPYNVMFFQNLWRPTSVRMWGAKIVCMAGARYGSFNPVTGVRHDAPGNSFSTLSYRATPYWTMVGFLNCTAPIRVEGGELDGNIGALQIGGYWNADGIQIGNFGLYFENCTQVTALDVNTHHHGLDGVYVGTPNLTDASMPMPHLLMNVRSRFNGRQAFSIGGANHLTCINCDFSKTGRAVNTGTGLPFVSSPGAGLDIEPNSGTVARNVLFLNCTFSDNNGVGVVTHVSSNCSEIHFERCKIVGTTNWSCWPNNPNITFANTLFVGTLTNAHSNATVVGRSTYFDHCTFSADPALSETGTVFVNNYLTVSLSGATDVVFNYCQFDSGPTTSHPLCFISTAIYNNCAWRQTGAGSMVTRGTFNGLNRITHAGTVSRSPSTVYGTLLINGVLQERVSPSSFVGDTIFSGTKLTPGTGFAAGTLTVTAQNAVLGDASRMSIDHGSGGGQVYLDSVLQASGYGTLSVRVRGVGGMNERFRVDNVGAVFFPGVATTASAANAFLDNAASNSLLRSTSSIRYKTDVETIEPEYDERIFDLRPVFYRSLAEADNPAWGWWGLIAEEVAEIDPRLVHWTYPPEAYEAVTIKHRQLVSGPNAKRKRYKTIETTEYVLKPDAQKAPDGVQYERLSVLLLSNYQRKLKAVEDRLTALEQARG